MEQEQQQHHQSIPYTRVSYKNLCQLKGHRVTIIGTVQSGSSNGSLVIECGPKYFVVVDNQRRDDIDNSVQLVEVRGTVLGDNSIHSDELVELHHQSKHPFDYETYETMLQYQNGPMFGSLFSKTD